MSKQYSDQPPIKAITQNENFPSENRSNRVEKSTIGADSILSHFHYKREPHKYDNESTIILQMDTDYYSVKPKSVILEPPREDQKYKWTQRKAFLLFLTLGQNAINTYVKNLPASIAPILYTHCGIKQSETSYLFSISAVASVFLTFFGGKIIQKYGAISTSIGVNLVFFISGILFSIGGIYKNFICLSIGRLLFGMIVRNISAIMGSQMSLYFKGDPIAFGMYPVSNSVGNFFCFLLGLGSFEALGFNQAIIINSAFLSGLSFVFAVLFWLFTRNETIESYRELTCKRIDKEEYEEKKTKYETMTPGNQTRNLKFLKGEEYTVPIPEIEGISNDQNIEGVKSEKPDIVDAQ